MFKKLLLFVLLFAGSFHLYAQQEEIPWREDITMLAVPRDPMPIQLAQDISRRYPVLLLCYQTTPGDPVLHAWNGETWVGVSTSDYTNGTFFTHRPRHAVIVEPQGRPAPEVLIPNGIWCESGDRLSSTDTPVMIHLLGRYFDFPYRYWMQFSKRYNYELETINPALINVPWVHYRGDQVMAAFKARDFDRDMDLWSPLDITPPEPVEPVVIEEEPVLPPAEVPAEEVEDELFTLPAEESADEATDISVETAGDKDVEIIVETTEPDTLIVDVKEVEDAITSNRVEMIEAESTDPVSEPVGEIVIDPFSTNEIPAAEVIISPAQ